MIAPCQRDPDCACGHPKHGAGCHVDLGVRGRHGQWTTRCDCLEYRPRTVNCPYIDRVEKLEELLTLVQEAEQIQDDDTIEEDQSGERWNPYEEALQRIFSFAGGLTPADPTERLSGLLKDAGVVPYINTREGDAPIDDPPETVEKTYPLPEPQRETCGHIGPTGVRCDQAPHEGKNHQFSTGEATRTWVEGDRHER